MHPKHEIVIRREKNGNQNHMLSEVGDIFKLLKFITIMSTGFFFF